MAFPDDPLVSIITPSYNQAAFIEGCIASVRQQDYLHIEHIVMDGGSTDDTLAILRRHEDHLTWFSEPDRGQTEALNKGFRRARGGILAWLNADDLYTPGAIGLVVAYFQAHPGAFFLYGDAEAIDVHGRSYGLRHHVRATSQAELVNIRNCIVQPAAFWRRTLWQALGELDESLLYVMDYEYWMRAAQTYTLHYLPVCLAQERLHPAAKTFNGGIARLEEIARIAQQHGGAGLPANFDAEAAATYALRGLSRLLTGHFRAARDDWRTAIRCRPPLLKFLRYVAAMLLFGRRIAWVWLVYTRLRSRYRTNTRALS